MPDAGQPSRYPRRPLRLERIYTAGPPIYFVTFNTHRRASILARAEVHAGLVEFCWRARDHNIAVGRYVVMPDHVHLFVAFPETGKVSLGAWIRALKTALGKRLLQLGVNKPHWQEGFFDHVIRNDESHTQKWEYVHNNPVRAGLCLRTEDWPYQGEVVAW